MMQVPVPQQRSSFCMVSSVDGWVQAVQCVITNALGSVAWLLPPISEGVYPHNDRR